MINKKTRSVIKYLVNILAIINMAIIGLSPVWGWDTWRITETVTVVIGVLGLVLVEQGIYKAYKGKKEKKVEG